MGRVGARGGAGRGGVVFVGWWDSPSMPSLHRPLPPPRVRCLWHTDTAKRLLKPITDWQSEGDAVVQEFKRELDTAWAPYWHVVIGKSFGSLVAHESRRMAFFYIEDKAVLVFKAA